MTQIPMTVQGEESLRKELQQLKTVDRPRIIQSISEAREHGDLKENAEYHAAREQQSFAEGRILEIESKLAEARVIDVMAIPNTGKVIFGTTVDICNEETGDEVCYMIVGDDEADLKVNKISINSPFARALIGKEVGDIAGVRTPNGIIEYEVLRVQHL